MPADALDSLVSTDTELNWFQAWKMAAYGLLLTCSISNALVDQRHTRLITVAKWWRSVKGSEAVDI